jgi:hypothetical protein
MMLANISGISELNLHPSEAHKLAECTQKVLEQYEVLLSPRALAWVDFWVNAGGIYSTRFVAYQLRKDAERRAKAGALGPVAVPRQQQPGPQTQQQGAGA